MQTLVQTLRVITAAAGLDLTEVVDNQIDIAAERVDPGRVVIAAITVGDDAETDIRCGLAQSDIRDHLADAVLDHLNLVPHAPGRVQQKYHIDARCLLRLRAGGKAAQCGPCQYRRESSHDANSWFLVLFL